MDIPESELRIDSFTRGVKSIVRVTHMPTGIWHKAEHYSFFQAKRLATAEVFKKLEASNAKIAELRIRSRD